MMPLHNDINPTPNVNLTKVPRIKLAMDMVPDAVASRLAMSLIGHVLFLNNQVPFPITQLGRIPSGKSAPRALKNRTELLASIDALSSHLDTTFAALSTALARRNASTGNNNEQKLSRETSRAYMAIMLGPSVASARARIIYAIDGLEVKVREESEDDDDDESAASSSSDEEDEDCATESESESESCASESDAAELPPPSRSPSPERPPILSAPPVPSQPYRVPLSVLSNSSSVRPVISRPPILKPTSYTDEEQALRLADRLLSRTLANASAENDNGLGTASEMASTQTHILIRAPRRFSHPAWIPREPLSRTMDGVLKDFHSLDDNAERTKNVKNKRKTARTEGVWITCRQSSGGVGAARDDLGADGHEVEDELDEMIWWSWDGKIVGFSDW